MAGQVFRGRRTSLRAGSASQVFAPWRMVSEDKAAGYGPEGTAGVGHAFKTDLPHKSSLSIPTDTGRSRSTARDREATVMAVELGPLGIRVNSVGPGPVRTGMNALDDPEEVADLEREIPLGRIGDPEDIASAIALLVSDDAAWVTGTTLFVDGGWIVRR